MAKTEFATKAAYAEPVSTIDDMAHHMAEKQGLKPKTKGAFVHIVKDDGTEVWFFADVPESIANSYPSSGAASVELIILP